MLSTNQKKFINSLKQKKYRKQHLYFFVEGHKMVEELLSSSFEVKEIYATQNWINPNSNINVIQVNNKELSSISSLTTPNDVLAIVKIPKVKQPASNKLVLALDNIQDPGNMGTIIRTADWFGINSIVCSTNTVDIYNPKVIQASMGSIFRVNVQYVSLSEYFNSNADKTIYGAVLDGEPINSQTTPKRSNSILLMGNESKGISNNLKSFIKHPISIPKIGDAESLNVASATSILCYQFTQS